MKAASDGLILLDNLVSGDYYIAGLDVGQVPPEPGALSLTQPGCRADRLGPLPIINHFIDRLGLDEFLTRFVPTTDGRCRLPYAKGLGVLLRTIIVEREPIYRQQEMVATFAPDAFGLGKDDVQHVGDDHIGRALEQLFDADRGAQLTEVAVAAVQRFDVDCAGFHNDSTSIYFCGQYAHAQGRILRGKNPPYITYGFSKDHRPDLKQLLFVMTTTGNGGIPAQFRCEAGNASDSRTHEETWETLRKITGHTNFLYVADSKLCGGQAMDYIHERGGRFVTVLPRSRIEDRHFRAWIQQNKPDWETVRDRPNPRRRHGPRNQWKFSKDKIPSKEGWPIVWVWSNLLALRQEQSRRDQLAKAGQKLEKLQRQLEGKKPRLRARADIQDRLGEILGHGRVKRYLQIRLLRADEHVFRQKTAGRPGPNTKYLRKTVRRYRLQWKIDEKRIEYDRKSDGMYPLLTNDRNLTPSQVLEAHKRQPTIEKRFEQTKTVFELAPVFLKNEDRVEALFYVYFLALLVQALIERELRRGMASRSIESLPLYPEERLTHRPTCEQVLRVFSLPQRTVLLDGIREMPAPGPELQRDREADRSLDQGRVPGADHLLRPDVPRPHPRLVLRPLQRRAQPPGDRQISDRADRSCRSHPWPSPPPRVPGRAPQLLLPPFRRLSGATIADRRSGLRPQTVRFALTMSCALRPRRSGKTAKSLPR